MPPVAPMLAKSVKDVPDGPGFLYEPKWDGFRCIVFRDGDEVELGSRNERPMTRYFPEVVAAVKEQLPERCVVDARDRHRGRRQARLRGAAAAHPPGQVPGRRCSPSRPRPAWWSSTCSRSATSPIWTLRWASGGTKLDQVLGAA